MIAYLPYEPVGGMEPNAGWQIWQPPDSEWPGSVLLAMEAVRAAKRQRPSAGGLEVRPESPSDITEINDQRIMIYMP